MKNRTANGVAHRAAAINTTTTAKAGGIVRKRVLLKPDQLEYVSRQCKRLGVTESDYLLGLVSQDLEQAQAVTTISRAESLPRPQRKKGESAFAFDDRIREEKREAARQRRADTRKTITVDVAVDDWGFLCAAAVLHNATPEQVMAQLVRENVTDWANCDYPLEWD